MTGSHPPPQRPEAGVAALVRGAELTTDRVEALVRGAELTTNHLALVAPGRGLPAHPEGARREGLARELRQRRRWATQVLVVGELAERACTDLGLRFASVGATAVVVDPADIAELGSIVAAALSLVPAARVLLDHLTAAQIVPEHEVSDYYRRNRDRFLTPEALRRGLYPFAPPEGDRPAHDGLSPDDVVPYPQVRPDIEAQLRRAAGRRALFDQLDRERAGVRYAPGYEHPGDPGHPDHEHRH